MCSYGPRDIHHMVSTLHWGVNWDENRFYLTTERRQVVLQCLSIHMCLMNQMYVYDITVLSWTSMGIVYLTSIIFTIQT